MSNFVNFGTSGSLTTKLWRGERMCMIGMDVTNPEPDFVGFSIEVKSPSTTAFSPLRNRLAFSYPTAATTAVNGFRNFPSLQAPFQKFRWLHFPYDPQDGTYTYRITKQHMPSDNKLVAGDSTSVDIALSKEIYSGFLDVGFTRSFASSQAYVDKFHNNPHVIPSSGASGLSFDKSTAPAGVYQWLGFEAYDLLFSTLNAVVNDPTLSLEVFAYDLDEPDIVAKFAALGPRLRIIIDDSGSHAPTTSDPSIAAQKLTATAGSQNVHRMHFTSSGLQHNKVLIVKKNGTPIQVLFGSTNFSFRGIYIQANNMLVFSSPEVAALFSQYFNIAFTTPSGFTSNPFSTSWHSINVTGKPPLQFCFSPHSTANLSLDPIGQAINQATSSVFFAIAFLNQTTSGAVRQAVDRLATRNIFSYGISDKTSSLAITKPDGSIAVVPFAYLASKAPPPFSAEWSGGSGINEHNKFVVTDFNLPTARVYTGSSNLAPSGETGNGDNLVVIQDTRIATTYAIEAVRIFDHLQFRAKMSKASTLASHAAQQALTLQKPTAISGQPKSWFASSYITGQAQRDRLLFSH
jgi:phosphatidylserine/phosphatidylglycerophosphate/cardiolipin synthase-like enzyme